VRNSEFEVRRGHSAYTLLLSDPSALPSHSVFRTYSHGWIIDNLRFSWLNRSHRSRSGPLGHALRVGMLENRRSHGLASPTGYPLSSLSQFHEPALTLVIN
jgi:hypothetical protein